MTYSSGNVILRTDFNAFAGPTAQGGNANANLNDFWNVGATDKGWGQTAVANPAAASVITAANQWTSLINNLATAGNQTGTTLTSRTAPVAGQTVNIFSNLNTDLTNVNTARGNAVASGTEYGTFTGTTSKTTATGTAQGAWTITFTHTITFPSADQLRYFFNAGGIVRLKYGKTSTGTDHDPDWNTLAGFCGSINLTGRVNANSQLIAGTTYTGTTRIGGTGGTQTTLATTTGWYNLTASPVTIFQLNNATAPYTAEFIRTQATALSTTQLRLVTVWSDNGISGAGRSSNISGGTATTSPSTTITGTAPTTLCTYIPPATTYLTNSWGTPTIAATTV
jgi:hypothetical protein